VQPSSYHATSFTACTIKRFTDVINSSLRSLSLEQKKVLVVVNQFSKIRLRLTAGMNPIVLSASELITAVLSFIVLAFCFDSTSLCLILGPYSPWEKICQEFRYITSIRQHRLGINHDWLKLVPESIRRWANWSACHFINQRKIVIA
jgi:hypothetical protein